jgi:Nuclease-related domain/UvrD-like helicase C-terminal domain/AAA domain
MAVFPQGLTHVDARCNAGERRVLHQIKRCLEDDYLVWHDIAIGARARQPDFVILSPRWGVLLLEVKDWRRSTLGAATRDAVELHTPRGRVTQPHPLRQARDYTMELVDLMKADPALVHPSGPFEGRLLFPYGWGVVFSSLKRADVHSTGAASDFDELFPPSRTLLRDDLEDSVLAADFQSRLWGLFTVSYPHTLTLPQRDRIRWHLFPDVRLPTQATLDLRSSDDGQGTAPPLLPSLLQVMDLQQEQVARSLGEGHRVIHGAAGSGKTMILIFRAQYLAAIAKPERPILVLCFNRTLATRIEALLRARGVDERVQVRTFHSWCQDMVRSYQLSVPAGLQGDDYFEALAQVLQRAVDSGRVPGGQYSALLIDEAHDFEDAWLAMAARMVSPATNSLLVLYDDAQSIYQTQRRNFSFASVGIQARGRTSVLRLNYRNTAEVLALAVQCAQHLLLEEGGPPTDATRLQADNADDHLQRVSPASAGRRGPLPVLLQARDAQEEAQWLAENLAAAQADGVALHDMAVLCRTRQQMGPIAAALVRSGLPVQSMASQAFRQFDWNANAVKLVTLHSAKGLEFAHVCIAGLQAWPLPGESLDDALRLLYVGMTRATQRLVLSAHNAAGERPLVQRVQAALQAVAARFAQV